MSATTFQRTYNTIKAGINCLTSPKVYLPTQKRFLPIHFEKDIYFGAINKVNKMVRARDKFLLTTLPKVETTIHQPIVQSTINNIDDIFNFLF